MYQRDAARLSSRKREAGEPSAALTDGGEFSTRAVGTKCASGRDAREELRSRQRACQPSARAATARRLHAAAPDLLDFDERIVEGRAAPDICELLRRELVDARAAGG